MGALTEGAGSTVAAPGFVLCVGLPLDQVRAIAAAVHGTAAVVATSDKAAAWELLRPVPPTDSGSPSTTADDPRFGDDVGRPVPRHLAKRAGSPAVLGFGPLRVDLASREVTARGTPIHLSRREFDLLAALASDVGRVWSFEELTHLVWRTGYLGDSDPVVSTVKRLRRRLTGVPDLEVASVRGVGFRLLVPA